MPARNLKFFAACIFLIPCLLSSCHIARHLPPNERLYVGTDISLKADSSVNKSEQSALKSGLEDLSRPRPNKTLFGYPYKVGLYYLLGEPKSENGFRAWFRKKLGEPPVFASSKALTSNATVWAAYLENEGYFRSGATGKLVENGYKARGVYEVTVKPRYYIDSVHFLIDSSASRKALFSTSPRTLLKQGDPYRFEVIKAERERINQTLQNRGFFYFQPDYVGILADSARGNHKLRLYVAIKPDMPLPAGQPYYIRNLYVYPRYSLGDADTNRSQAYTVRGDTSLRQVYIVDSARLYKPALFNDVLALKPGRRYSSRSHDLTLSRFINVGSFKFVRNRFVPTIQHDTAFLDVHYYLTPYPKRSMRFELDGVTRSNGLAGSQLTLSWINRNFMGRSEILTINGTAGVDFQLGGGVQGVRNIRYGINGVLTFPRLVSPLRFRYDQRQLLPKTSLTIGYERLVQGVPKSVANIPDSLAKGTLYAINSFNTSFGYSWRKNQQIEQSLIPFGINYVYFKLVNDKIFFDYLAADPATSVRYLNLYLRTDQFILNSVYTLNYNSSPRSKSPHAFQIRYSAETAGNVASVLIPKDSLGYRRIFTNPFYQYLRSDIDLRHYYKLTPGMTWANRLFAGMGYSYGNYTEMPLIKQYFVGGSNSLRGFRARAIGPGVTTRDTTGVVPLFFDGGGDIKLEFNSELRPKFTKYLQGALFVDAGNVWMAREEGYYGKGSKITKDFYKQIAVSGGIGLRVDLSYFLIRLDLGMPLRKPYLTNGKYWVLDRINFRDREWRRQNLILNIAVGYPF